METPLKRNGYGSAFNDIYISDTKVIKKSKNEYGHKKIRKEIIFYKFLIDNNIVFPIPHIYELNDTSYTMQNLKDYISLYKVFPNFTYNDKSAILDRIHNELNNLHTSSTISVSKMKFEECLIIETSVKILERIHDIKGLIDSYSHIKKVNGIILKSFDIIMATISQKIQIYTNSLCEYKLSIIHGDCQFNNILYNTINGKIAFIDPRGYYGSIDLYGIPQYDSAKILFALSGYDVFDNMDVIDLDIREDTLYIPNLFITNESFFKGDDIASILALSIWLGNAHCFKHNPQKAIYSYFYALYLCSSYL